MIKGILSAQAPPSSPLRPPQGAALFLLVQDGGTHISGSKKERGDKEETKKNAATGHRTLLLFFHYLETAWPYLAAEKAGL